ncbi:helix-turn-helix transcriptional regulator [Brevundimonas diminuta]|uniref:helix-turn-helix domain-containing protein n=1 Tax=Brevundimonas diminuta TaxID=293 RepID=UPI002097B50B|nr:helix-turn-helix transcriptional regulator [Brevundimonas diminuta]MCO8031182.1 helix-turn-helix transcriptional regulator [Brevundimonas diminuta]
MPIIVRLDVMMARRKVRSNVLARAIGISETNLSLLKSGKVRGLRFATLDAICRYLDCSPADILEYAPESEKGAESKWNDKGGTIGQVRL